MAHANIVRFDSEKPDGAADGHLEYNSQHWDLESVGAVQLYNDVEEQTVESHSESGDETKPGDEVSDTEYMHEADEDNMEDFNSEMLPTDSGSTIAQIFLHCKNTFSSTFLPVGHVTAARSVFRACSSVVGYFPFFHSLCSQVWVWLNFFDLFCAINQRVLDKSARDWKLWEGGR